MSRGRKGRADPAAFEGGLPWLDPADAPPPGLLLFADDPAALEAALAAGPVAGVVAGAAALPAVRPVARRHGLALLALDDPAAADADGVHLSAPGGSGVVARARGEAGEGRIVGVACGLSRHAAMVAGEAGADYVLFGDLDDRSAGSGDDHHHLPELVAWWNQLFVIPCAAASGGLDAAAARALLTAGADMLAVRGEPAPGVAEALREVADDARPLPPPGR